jgi:hypothetical protein
MLSMLAETDRSPRLHGDPTIRGAGFRACEDGGRRSNMIRWFPKCEA